MIGGAGHIKQKLCLLHEQSPHLIKNPKGLLEEQPGTYPLAPGTALMAVDEMENYLGLVGSGPDRTDDFAHMLGMLEGKEAGLEYRSYTATVSRVMVSQTLLQLAHAREIIMIASCSVNFQMNVIGLGHPETILKMSTLASNGWYERHNIMAFTGLGA